MKDDVEKSPNLKQASLLLAWEREQAASRQTWLTGIKSIDAQLKDAFSGGRVLGISSRSDGDETIVSLNTDIPFRVV